MRNLAFICFSLTLLASEPPKVPAPPPPPPLTQDDPDAIAPDVSIVQKEDATHTEYRVAGRLYMIKVTPKFGPPYYLVDDEGKGSMVRRDGQPTLKPPMWVIKRF